MGDVIFLGEDNVAIISIDPEEMNDILKKMFNITIDILPYSIGEGVDKEEVGYTATIKMLAGASEAVLEIGKLWQNYYRNKIFYDEASILLSWMDCANEVAYITNSH